jgi:uncharacterized membrane protein YeaQ/YmgE (transglycosylase-associated protein family)
MKKGRRSLGLAILSTVVGGLVGSILGRLLASAWHPLGQTLLSLGSQPGTAWSIDLGFLGVQLGLWLKLNVVGLIGLMVGLFWYLRGA